eukprot:371489_1
MGDLLSLKDCHSLWILLDRLYTLKEGKWIDIPANISLAFRKKIYDQEIILQLKQFVNGCDFDDILQFLIDWKEFMKNILSNTDHIKYANQTTLESYLYHTITNPSLLQHHSFPADIKLVHCVFSYMIATRQFQSKAIANCYLSDFISDSILESDLSINRNLKPIPKEKYQPLHNKEQNQIHYDAALRTKVLSDLIYAAFHNCLQMMRFPVEMNAEVSRISQIFLDPYHKTLKRAVLARIASALFTVHNESLLQQLKEMNESSQNRLQIATKVELELVNTLFVIFNNHSSNLYHPRMNFTDAQNDKSYAYSPTDVQRKQRENDSMMRKIWLTLFQHENMANIIREKSNDNNNIVEIKIKVEFPFSTYIYSYFHDIKKTVVNTVEQNAEMKVTNSGIKGQTIMIPIIVNHLKAANLDDCLLVINKYIEWYVYDVAVLQIQNRLGSKADKMYFEMLTKFIQQFILCASHQIHHKFEKKVIIDLEIDETDDEIVLDESITSDEIGTMMVFDNSDHDSDISDAFDESDTDEKNETKSHYEYDGESDESDTDEKDNKIYECFMHEIHAALWCNEDLLHRLINIMTIFEYKPQLLQDITFGSWKNFHNDGLLKCVHNTMNEITDLIIDQLKNSNYVMFKILIKNVSNVLDSVTWTLNWTEKQYFSNKLSTLSNKCDVVRLYLICYEPFEKFQSEPQLTIIKNTLLSIINEFESNQNSISMSGNITTIKFICGLMHKISDQLNQLNANQNINSREAVQYVIQQYANALSKMKVRSNEEFLISLLTDTHIYDDEKDAIKTDSTQQATTVKEFLQQCRLQKYLNALQQQGVESLDDFLDLNNEELDEIANQAKMKRLHKRQFITGVQNLQTQQKLPPPQPKVKANDEIVLISKLEQQMQRYQLEQNKINELIETTLHQQYLPLHRFTAQNIADKIRWWMYNDMNYKNGLLKTMKIFSKEALSGHSMNYFTSDQAKRIVQRELLAFMTRQRLDIMFECFGTWKKQNMGQITALSASEIGYIIYHYPLNNLLAKIVKDQIDGPALMQCFQEYDQFMEKETGWKSEDINQLYAILFRHCTLLTHQITNNMINITNDQHKSLPNFVKTQMKKVIAQFDVETLHFKIRNGLEIEEFSDKIINMVDEATEHNEQNKIDNKNDAYFKDDFVKRIYEAVANIFVLPTLNDDNITLHSKQEWICLNCSNRNFVKFIGGKLSCDILFCSLCGLQQAESIMLKLKNCDTFIMVNNIDAKHVVIDNNDDVDDLIATALQHQPLDISCLNRNDNIACPSLMRLAKHLIKYKRWLTVVYERKENNDIYIDTTTHVDIGKYTDNNTYKTAFIECATNIKKITDDQLQTINQMFDNNTEGIVNIEWFLNSKRVLFARTMKTETGIKVAVGGRLYKNLMNLLKRQAQTIQHSEFLTDLDMSTIDEDYHHILKAHINFGNKITIENTFRFFQRIVHYEDVDGSAESCKSCNRREQRISSLNKTEEEKKTMVDNVSEDTADIWLLKMNYIQTQLDIIHSYLVHSSWKLFVQRYANQHDKDDCITDDFKATSDEMDPGIAINKSKYMTEASGSNESNYGFGIDMYHPHLTDIYNSLHIELLCNKLCPMAETQFERMLIKAVGMHTIALGDNYKHELICKYWHKYYNILRNEHIGIRHILVLIIYTDLSDFCTEYRKTYRYINNESKEEQVTQRHRQLYHYSRYLLESIEFFGKYMENSLTVYHGLNKIMLFEKFNAYFNQPISTTSSLTTALQFAKGRGVVLTLKSGAQRSYDKTKIPKYLSVSWLSCFPNESEKLFYGTYVVFRIHNITEAETLNGHATELQIFNKFQQTLQNKQNKPVKWDINDKKGKKMIEALVVLIKQQQNVTNREQTILVNKDIEDEQDEKDDSKENDVELYGKYITNYGRQLFHYFCTNKNTTQIMIRDFKSLPRIMYD